MKPTRLLNRFYFRHNNYTWAVLEEQQEDPSVFYKDADLLNITDPCSHPDTIKCGQTGNTCFSYVSSARVCDAAFLCVDG